MGSGYLSHYDVLGIKRNATSSEIKKAYQRMSLSLHPDKNPHGEPMMKLVNEARDVLLDAAKKASYDREENRGNRGSNNHSANDAQIRNLKQQLAESKRERTALQRKVINLQNEAYETQHELSEIQHELSETQYELSQSQSLLSETNRQSKKLKNKLHHSEQEKKRIENDNTYLKKENDILERENRGYLNKIDVYENKMEKATRALREERQKSSEVLARSAEKAREQIEDVTRVLSERSVCYRCNGEATNTDCLCKGSGAVQGSWTKCHACNGMGSYTSISGEEKQCSICSSKGAREGIYTLTCFKCKGRKESRKDCNVCYKGKIRGFNLQLCPFCKGEGERMCENCFGKAHVPCRCGILCKGHGCNEIPKALSSLQRELLALENDTREALEDYTREDWQAKFLTRNWEVNIGA
ncbi:hypothetical protein ACHAWF_004369 [Thalassiosira exigua]